MNLTQRAIWWVYLANADDTFWRQLQNSIIESNWQIFFSVYAVLRKKIFELFNLLSHMTLWLAWVATQALQVWLTRSQFVHCSSEAQSKPFHKVILLQLCILVVPTLLVLKRSERTIANRRQGQPFNEIWNWYFMANEHSIYIFLCIM